MKSPPLLLMAAACAGAGAASLRGDAGMGVEEVGEQVEHFPPEDYEARFVDRRRSLLDEDGEDGTDESESSTTAGHPFDEWPDRDIVGIVVEDEDEVYVREWREGGDGDEGEEEETANDEERAEEDDDERDDRGGEDEPAIYKEYAPDPDSVTLVGTDLRGEAVDQYDRRDAACDENKSEFKIMLQTDEYGYETKWKLVKINGNEVMAEGPPSGRNYADASTYSGRWCLSPGQYKFQVIDNGRDGICSSNPIFGCGRLMLFLNGQNAGRMINDKSNWHTRDFPFLVAVASRIDGVNSKPDNSNLGPWCKKVRSVTKVPRGTCTLPNGRRGHRVRVTTKVDKYGKETSWTVTERRSNAVKMKMGPVVEKHEQKSVEDCLPEGEYNLQFQDLDGICCRHGQGFFKLVVDGQELLGGGSFTKSVDHDFQLGFDWIGSMKERDCEWWWAHDYRRRDWHTRCYAGQYCGKTYRHLRWSPALKADAREYANELLKTCATSGIKHAATDQGENLAKNKGKGSWGRLYDADAITKRFVDKEEFKAWNLNAHLTQAMWYPSRYIGCAESVKDMGGGEMCRMQVCRYAKSGNCMMSKYDAASGNNWMKPMMMDDSPCGPMCASDDGCYL